MNIDFISNFREVIRVFEREIFYQNTTSCCSGVSLAQCHTLLEIEKNSEISVSELADKLTLDKSTVSRTVDNLVKKDLIDRVIPKENRRKAILDLTESGKEICSSINYTHDSYVENMFSGFTETETQDFLKLFTKLTDNMKNSRITGCCE